MPKSTQKEAAVQAAPVKSSITPVMTEKAYGLEASRVYVFQVPRRASKAAIAQAITREFQVTVTSIRTLLRKGKPTRFSRGKHAYPGTTHRQDQKLAYITVKAGEHIPVFDELKQASETDASKESQDTTKASKEAAKAEKQAEKAQKEAEKEAKKAEKQTAKAETKTTKATKTAKGDK